MNDETITDVKINHISEGVRRLEDMLREANQNNIREYEKVHRRIDTIKDESEKRFDAIETKQGQHDLDFQKFRVKVTTWAAAGSLVGGAIMKLFTK